MSAKVISLDAFRARKNEREIVEASRLDAGWHWSDWVIDNVVTSLKTTLLQRVEQERAKEAPSDEGSARQEPPPGGSER